MMRYAAQPLTLCATPAILGRVFVLVSFRRLCKIGANRYLVRATMSLRHRPAYEEEDASALRLGPGLPQSFADVMHAFLNAMLA